MDVNHGTGPGIAGGVVLTAVYVVGAFLLGIFTPDIDTGGRWLTVLTDVFSGTPSGAVVAYLIAPGIVVSALVFGVERFRRADADRWSDLGTVLLLVAIPGIGMFLIAFGYALYTAVRVVGVAGTPLAVPFAVFFVAVADGVLIVSTTVAVAVGYAVVDATVYVYRRIGAVTAG